MTSLPELYFSEDGAGKWFIEFYCPYDEQIVPVWASEYEALIDQTTDLCDERACGRRPLTAISAGYR